MYYYKRAIDEKCKQLTWSQLPDNGCEHQLTKGQKGWVVYYGNQSRATYCYPKSGAFGLLKLQMEKYDAIGQEMFLAGSVHVLGTPYTSVTKAKWIIICLLASIALKMINGV